MSKDIKYYRIRSCTYKHKLPSLKEGIKHLFQKRDNGIDVDACYKCVFCDQYHIGHYSKQGTRRRNRKIVRQYLSIKT
jgi:hypothetical protein